MLANAVNEKLDYYYYVLLHETKSGERRRRKRAHGSTESHCQDHGSKLHAHILFCFFCFGLCLLRCRAWPPLPLSTASSSLRWRAHTFFCRFMYICFRSCSCDRFFLPHAHHSLCTETPRHTRDTHRRVACSKSRELGGPGDHCVRIIEASQRNARELCQAHGTVDGGASTRCKCVAAASIDRLVRHST